MPHVAQTTWAGIVRRHPGGGRRGQVGRGAGAHAVHDRLLLRRPGDVRHADPGARAGRRDRLLRVADPRSRQRHADPGRRRGRRWRARSSACSAARTPGSRPRPSREFDEALTAAGVDHRLITYDGAPHSFFDRKAAEFADASAAAWGEVLGFIAAQDRCIDGDRSGPGDDPAAGVARLDHADRPGRSKSAAAAMNAASIRVMPDIESVKARIVEPAPDRQAPMRARPRGRPRPSAAAAG